MMAQVDVIDSIMITEEYDKTKILAEWSVADPSITVYGDLTSAYAVKLFLNWSDHNGTVALQTGDYFTFVVPDIFRQDNIKNVTDAAIKTPLGEVVATYSIYDNSNNMKEVKITFTDYVKSHTDILGNFWLLLYVGAVDSTEEKTIKFVVNGDLAASGEIKVKPPGGSSSTPHNEKFGKSVVGDIYNGYYIFNWTVRINMEEDAVNGFHKIENFSFEDVIPADSPHIFLTEEIRQELGLSSTQFPLRIGEYKGADSYPPEDRYSIFYYQYNSFGANLWSNFNVYAPLTDGYTTVGIDGTDGLNVSNRMLTEKLLSAKLGTLTRPTTIQYCTIATVKIAESALGDPEVVKLFENTFKVSYGEDMTKSLDIHRFESGGTAQGISGDYSFEFAKVDESGAALPGAMFSLYISEDFSAGADRIVYSESNGVVAFKNLPEGIFYVLETTVPYGYILDGTIYKVELKSTGFEIYYGDNYENKLSDHGNKVVNYEVVPITVTLTGTKRLTGRELLSGMFSFVVRDNGGAVAATGVNDANGNISFSEMELDGPGVYTFKVEEVRGTYSGVTYDSNIFNVTVMVTDEGSVDVTYPDGGIVFNNSYAAGPITVTLTGIKRLTGRILESGMFNFVVKDSIGSIVATGTNTANGGIVFSEIEFVSTGEYTFMVEEVAGGYSGITYDSSKYTVTVTVTYDGSGNLTADVAYPDEGVVFKNSYAKTPVKPCPCFAKTTKCRKSIEGQKIWVDNDNVGNMRPSYVKITLLRDGEVYKSLDVDSTGDGTFIFCCVPIGKKPSHKYDYQIDELDIPDGYTKTIEGYNVINTLIQ